MGGHGPLFPVDQRLFPLSALSLSLPLYLLVGESQSKGHSSTSPCRRIPSRTQPISGGRAALNNLAGWSRAVAVGPDYSSRTGNQSAVAFRRVATPLGVRSTFRSRTTPLPRPLAVSVFKPDDCLQQENGSEPERRCKDRAKPPPPDRAGSFLSTNVLYFFRTSSSVTVAPVPVS